jgi:HK97 family phage major capsid protein
MSQVAVTLGAVAQGDLTEPRLMSENRDSVLGKPWRELSTMATTTTGGEAILLYGDVQRGYRIVDRLGLSIEVIPHVFGTANNYPTGERGVFCFGRVGAGVVNANALRVLTVTS